jgi:uncharacterized protein DUF4245
MRHHGGVASETETPTAPPDAPADGPGAGPARRRGIKTVRDMFLSMLVISVGAFFLYLFIPHDESREQIRPVEYEVAAATAARAAPYELLVPEGLPTRWVANSVRYEPQGTYGATWRLGFVDPDEEYAAIAQADGDAGGFIAEVTQQARNTGSAERIDGRDWARYEGPRYDALVLREPGVTTVVLGTAPFDSLTRLAAALEPEAPGAPR